MMKEQWRRYNPDVGIKEIYDYYCHLYFKEKYITSKGEISKNSIVHKDSKYNINKHLYNKIIKQFHELISIDIINGKDFVIPERLGIVGIRKTKIKIKVDEDGKVVTNAPVDFKSTMDLWKENKEAKEKKVLIRHLNQHTQKYVHRWYWNKGSANFRNKSAYSFIPSRSNKRELAKILKDDTNNIDYYTRYERGKK